MTVGIQLSAYQCTDRTGRELVAHVWIIAEDDGVRWRAIFLDTGPPVAEMLGSSACIDNIDEDLRRRVRQLQVDGRVFQPSR